MAIDSRLLDVLCCPATGVPLRRMSKDELKRLNTLIAAGDMRDFDDNPVVQPVAEALITENDERIYRVEDDIPIMLQEKALPGKAVVAAD